MYRTIAVCSILCGILLVMSCSKDDSPTGSSGIIAAPDTLWTQVYGSEATMEFAKCVLQSDDGGYVVAAATGPNVAQSMSTWLFKTDEIGNFVWQRTYDMGSSTITNSLQPTTDGGYVLGGSLMQSYYIDENIWLLKTDALGIREWDKTIDIMPYETCLWVEQTLDGGYILTGYTESYGEIPDRLLLIKTDAEGDSIWSLTYDDAAGYCVKQTADGGYIVAGNASRDEDGGDILLLKADSNGDTLWTRRFAQEISNSAASMQVTTDDGFIIVGQTYDDIFYRNIYMIKTDSNGNEEWHSIFDYSYMDGAGCVQQTANGGYIIVGSTVKTSLDVYVIKTDELGNKEWDKAIDVNFAEQGEYIEQTMDGGYIIAGHTVVYGQQHGEAILIKLGSEQIN